MKTITVNEKDFEQCICALKVIQTWATFRNGQELVPEHVEKLCKKSLKPFKNQETK